MTGLRKSVESMKVKILDVKGGFVDNIITSLVDFPTRPQAS
jgi:hypothetical protein